MFFKFFKDALSSSKILEAKFLQSLGLLKTGVENERGCLLFIVILEDKLHFELIYLKVFSRLLIGPNSS